MRGRLAILIVLTLLISGFYYYSLTYTPKEKTGLYIPKKPSLHLANDNTKSIYDVNIKVVYFTPVDLEPLTNWEWKDGINKTMEDVARFYNLQLGNRIRYNIYPNVVVGKETHAFYDGEKTDNGNPNALISVREEVLKRLFNKNGDLFDGEFLKLNKNTYEILLIIYEGTGASAMIYQNNDTSGTDVFRIETDGPPAIILSSAYLNSQYYIQFGSTILAHEIGHSFALSDSIDDVTNSYKDNDLMGAGRRRTIGQTYISEKNKKILNAE